MTAEQQVARLRDVPQSCVCEWAWRGGRWVRILTLPRCPWHGAPVATVDGVS